MPSLLKGGIVLCWSGLIKCFSVFHQSLGPVLVRFGFSVSLVVTCCFDLRISLVTSFLNRLYLSKWISVLDLLYLSYNLFFLRRSFFNICC